MISTGGIIALGLGVKQWSLNHCISEFIQLCDKAFTPREFDGLAGLTQATTLTHGSKYKTRPLRDTLEAVFGEENLYCGTRTVSYKYDTKVAVTTTSGTGQRAVVLANYTRQEENEPNYKFEFPHDMRVWEAARATSAAPSFFKPFEGIGKPTYLDGAIYYNNPAKVANTERKLLWPDVADSPPVVLLSIGTGMNKHKIEQELRNDDIERKAAHNSKPQRNTKVKRITKIFKPKTMKPTAFGWVSRYFDVLVSYLSEHTSQGTLLTCCKVNRIDKILDAEREWKQFLADISDGKQNLEDISRYIRINIDLGEDPPALDDKSKLTYIQSKTLAILRTAECQSFVEQVAHRLIASSFYFQKDGIIKFDEATHTWTCTGKYSRLQYYSR